jgi:DNA-binding transcriptional LysR family regulator
VDEVGALLGKPSGTVRLTATKHGVASVVMPILPRFLASHPDIRVDIIADDNLADTVADRIDAGIRFGYIVEKDMIAVRIGPDIQMAVVGALSYFVDRPVPRTPRDLAGHRCINYGHIRSGGFYAWNPRRREGASRCVSIARIQADKQQLSKSLNFRKKIGCVPDLLARSKLRKASVPPAAIRRSS